MKEEIQKFFKGEVEDSEETLSKYSKDASLFEVRPKLVVFPKDARDLEVLIEWMNRNPGYTLTMRAAGTDMSGGPLSESIVADVTRHMNNVGEIKDNSVTVQPGLMYRDLELKTLNLGLILPCYPASKSLCALGGMIANNCGGERTLRYGKMEDYVLESKVIFSDGVERVVKPLDQSELKKKISQKDFEGKIYKDVLTLVEGNKELLKKAKPQVSKNSAGYYLWNVWDGETFDLNKLLVGSQGTLGVVTEAKVKLIPEKKYHDMVALFFKSWEDLPGVVNAILPHEVDSLETFDTATIKLGLRFMPEIAHKAGTNFVNFAVKFLPEAMISVRMFGLPKLVVLVEVSEDSEEKVKSKVKEITKALKKFDNVWHRVIEKDSEEEKFWIVRRESFNLLRKHVSNKRTAPFVDDFCVKPDKVPEFLPRALKILSKAGIKANITGHAGNGNFHIIPLMDMSKASERAKITKVSDKFYDLVHEFGGSITGEHNDGIVRTPYLGKMYSPEVLELFKKTKEIFDPHNILNPGKKVPASHKASQDIAPGTVEYLESHISKS